MAEYYLKQSDRWIDTPTPIKSQKQARVFAKRYNKTDYPVYVYDGKKNGKVIGTVQFTYWAGDGWFVGSFWKKKGSKKVYKVNSDGTLGKAME